MIRRDDVAREILIEAAATAYRARDAAGNVLFSPAWRDLTPADRDEAFERRRESRVIECAVDAEGLSATVRAVLARVR